MYLIKGRNSGRMAWYYILVDKTKLTSFKQNMLKKNDINLSEYGKIIYSGWGKNPPEEIIKIIKKEYYS